jgi:hypothetical protein
MAMAMERFRPYKIVHVPGKNNIEADYLSRLVAPISHLVATITLNYAGQDDINERRQKKPADFITDAMGRFRFVGDGSNRLAIPLANRKEILEMLHDLNGHLGDERVLDLARDRFYWKHMRKDIIEHCKACHKCAIHKNASIPKAEMKPTCTEVSERGARWQIDVLSGLDETANGYTHVISAQDTFTKWVETKPVRGPPSSRDATEFIQSALIFRYGVPKEIVTDNGSIFVSREYRTFLRSKGIKLVNTTPYNHKSTGVVERFNRTLGERLRTMQPAPNRWDEVLDSCVSSYRTSKHKSTKLTPFVAMHGFNPRLQVDVELSIDPPVVSASPTDIRTSNTGAIAADARQSKVRYDRINNTQARDLDGQKVYWKNCGPRRKLDQKNKGPFLAERVNQWNYKLTDREGNTKTVHVDQLRLCNSNEDLAPGLRSRGRPRRIAPIVFPLQPH